MRPIPFFVADRPRSLELLRFCEINKLPFKIGLMSHANTSKRFRMLFKEFEGENIIKMADSGVFSKDGCKYDYKDLFDIYECMGVDYGIIIDVLKDKDKTIESSQKAMKIYKDNHYKFKIVGVAQGKTMEEYLACYKKLKEIGYKYIAIGGLLKKIENSSRYVRVRNEEFLEKVIKNIREIYPNDWLFLLGCFHPKRIYLFKKYNIFGADYKGWILNYNPPSENERKTKSKDELKIDRFNQVKEYLYKNIFKYYFPKNKKLLIISCSKRKRSSLKKGPAIDIYDGPFFRLLRKYKLPNVDIFIISAKYGLIHFSNLIELYDLKMSTKIANAIKNDIMLKLKKILQENQYKEIVINLGKNYLRVIDWLEEENLKNYKIKITFLNGKIGERLQYIKKWLETEKKLHCN